MLSFIHIVGATLVTLVIIVSVVLLDRPQQIELPVVSFWPQIPEQITVSEGPTAEVVEGGFTHAEVLVSGLGNGVKFWLAVGHLTRGTTAVLIGLAVLHLASSPDRTGVFRPAVSRAVTVAGVAIMVGGIVWQVAFSIAGSIASQETLRYTSWRSEGEVPPTVTESFPPSPLGIAPTPDITVEFWPVFVGVAVLAVAATLRYGEKGQSPGAVLNAAGR
ncbi:hypothetical protein E8P82_05585 [Arthrobacter echini]|uniref:Uncharacterized protein n=1 Tax=Arthrobacter echini TaxID=1529066 RepID=A0A4S5E5U3_9MICC|nr:hypothetical protein [Arthrobacter echini]THJ66936.1 hypothetical protein E8P82_05585 [Arthrobacter echini]